MLEACIDYHFTNGYPVMAEIAMDSRDYCSYDCMLEGQLERLEELQDAIQEDDIVEVLTDMANGRGYE